MNERIGAMIIARVTAALVVGLPTIAVAADDSIVGWGHTVFGKDLSADFVAIATHYENNLGLKSDGSIVAWGGNWDGQCDVPAPNTGFVEVATGPAHCLGLKFDGSIVAWGTGPPVDGGERDVPAPNTDFTAVAAGWHSMGLKSDGSIVAWGDNVWGQCDVPAPNTDFMAVAAGRTHSLGLRSDGSIVAWGESDDGQCDVPAQNTNFVAVSAGSFRSLGIVMGGPSESGGEPIPHPQVPDDPADDEAPPDEQDSPGASNDNDLEERPPVPEEGTDPGSSGGPGRAPHPRLLRQLWRSGLVGPAPEPPCLDPGPRGLKPACHEGEPSTRMRWNSGTDECADYLLLTPIDGGE